MADAQTGAYKPISQFQTPEDFSALLSQQKQARQRREIEWKLNLAYYRGDQWVYWNPGMKQIERVPTEDGEKPRYRVRITVNQITPGTQSLISKLIKTKPIFQAEPGQVGDKAVKAAEFSEMLLEGWWRQFELGAKYEEALLWSIHCGDGYIFVDWDPFANKSMRVLLDPQGQPITDEAHANEYRGLLEQAGIPPQEQVVYMGDLRARVMSPFHVFGDPTAQDASSWKWCITQHNLDPDDVYARYGVQVAPDAVAQEPEAPLPIAPGIRARTRTSSRSTASTTARLRRCPTGATTAGRRAAVSRSSMTARGPRSSRLTSCRSSSSRASRFPARLAATRSLRTFARSTSSSTGWSPRSPSSST
jgi:hypothetical protein